MLDRNILLALAFAAPLAASAQTVAKHVPRPVWGGSVVYGWGGAWVGGPCPSYACGLGSDYRTQLRRELRFLELREGGPPAGYPAYPLPPHALPSPTPTSDILPAYRDASQIRPEFRRSGDPKAE